jgi:chaperonin GroES
MLVVNVRASFEFKFCACMLQIQEGVVVAAGPGLRTKDGSSIPVSLKEGDKVLLPNYGGTEVKMEDKQYLVFVEDDILAKIE